MPDTTGAVLRVQASGRDPHALAQQIDPYAPTAFARLRLLLASRWCSESVAELAECVGASERHVRRMLVEIERTYGARFVQVPLTHRRSFLSFRRRILPVYRPSRRTHTEISLSDHALLTRDDRIRILDRSDPARAPRAVRKKSPQPVRRVAARLEPLPPPPAFMRNEGGVLAALELRRGRAARIAVLAVLREPECQARPVACELAIRTLTAREGVKNPGGYFRTLFREACRGEVLCDRRTEALRTCEVEALEVARHEAHWAWDTEPIEVPPPLTDELADAHGRPSWVVHWKPPPEAPLVPLEARTADLARARRELDGIGKGLD